MFSDPDHTPPPVSVRPHCRLLYRTLTSALLTSHLRPAHLSPPPCSLLTSALLTSHLRPAHCSPPPCSLLTSALLTSHLRPAHFSPPPCSLLTSALLTSHLRPAHFSPPPCSLLTSAAPPSQDDMRWMASMWSARPGFDSDSDVVLEYMTPESVTGAGLRSVTVRLPGADMSLIHARWVGLWPVQSHPRQVGRSVARAVSSTPGG